MLALSRKIAKNQGKKIFALVLLILLSNLLEGIGISLVIPVFQKLLNNGVSPSGISLFIDHAVRMVGIEPTLRNILILLNIAFVSKTLVAVAAKYFSTAIASDYLQEMQIGLFENLMRARLSFFHKEKQGRFINGMTTEIVRTSNVFILVATWISSLITAILYLFIALKISWQLAILAGVIGLVCVAPLRIINLKATRYGTKWTGLNEKIQSLLGETFSGMKYIKASAFEKGILEKFRILSKMFRDNWAKMAFNSNLAALFSHPIGVFVLSILLYASVSFSIGIPELIVFLLAFMRLLPTLASMAGLKNDINSNVSALELIEQLNAQSRAEQELNIGQKKIQFQHQIELHNIQFRHSPQVPLLKGINWRIPFGKTIAIMGPSGCGKTTLVDLILRLYDLQGGSIQVDDCNLNELNLESWRSQIAYVAQDTFLFHDSVKNNILISDPHASEEEVVAAAKMAHAHEFILDLEEGYSTIVGDRGSRLSGGQKQRIALARALLKKPRLLILDEATSALDSRSEELIRQTIHDLKKQANMTIIIIAHRMATVVEADEIFTLEASEA